MEGKFCFNRFETERIEFFEEFMASDGDQAV
jgi:hypothetical protein